jgi:hypothetical protein
MARPNFFNENANRSFPFTADSIQQSGNSSAIDYLPDSAIVDLGISMNPGSEFVEGDHGVTLDIVRRENGRFYFHFKTTATGASDSWLIFACDEDNSDYLTAFADAVPVSQPYPTEEADVSASYSVAECGEPAAWEGYVTFGDLTALRDFLADNTALMSGDKPIVEPALIQNYSAAFVRSIGVANGDRTRASTPDECRDLVWKQDLEDIYVRANCLTGRFRFEEGYNANIEQVPSSNGIRFSAEVGAGAGQVCDTVELYQHELPPFGKTNLDGADSCDEVIRSINGLGGRVLELLSGAGVSITPQPAENKIKVAIDLNSLKACIDLVEAIEESECSFADEQSASCGPVE